jgi:ADP-ribose pyrophosphatase YjhB (NUDIX family)
MTSKWLPTKEFAAIYKKVPRLCIDAVIKGRKGVVFAKRDIKPWKGKWHLPGGTVRFGERLTAAVSRIMYEETGLTVRIRKFLGVLEYVHEEHSARTHSVSAVFLVSPRKGALRGSPQGREVKYFSRFPKNIISEQKTFLKQQKL